MLPLVILASLAAVVGLKYAEAMFIPVVLGVLLSYALEPLVVRVSSWRIPRPISAGLVLMLVVAGAGTLLYQLRYQAGDVVDRLPAAAQRFRRTLERERPAAKTALEQVQKAAAELEKAADGAGAPPRPPSGVTRVQIVSAPFALSDYVVWGSVGIAAVFGQLVLVLFLTYFLLASGDLIRRKLVKIAGPSLTQKKVTVQILEEINHQIESFLLVQLFTSALVGVVSWLAFEWFGLEQAGVWGLLAGVFNSIPYFGPVVVTGGIAVVAFLQFGTFEMVTLIAGAALAITTIEGFLLTPWLTSRAARMNAVAVFVGLIFWGWVWEVWGLLLAVPMMMIVKVVCDHVEDFKPVAELLSD
jgi:predicted PurR-regulated permease PerM